MRVLVLGAQAPGPEPAVAWRCCVAEGEDAGAGDVRRLPPATPTGTALTAVHRPEYRPAFTQCLMDERPDVVHATAAAGWTYDLMRAAALLGYPLVVDPPAPGSLPEDDAARALVADALSYADALRVADEPAAEAARGCWPELADRLRVAPASLAALYAEMGKGRERSVPDYSAYEFGLRDQGLIERMQQPHVPLFQGCRRVLDVACGPGVFLDLLARGGVPAEGVERNPAAVRYARGLGFRIYEADAVDYVTGLDGVHDGIYCSHFIEHLSIDGAERLVKALAGALAPGGVLVLVTPNPESLRSQLLGFWRDPEHVRFYHPELVALMARGAGLQVVQGGAGHAVPRFPSAPPPPPASPQWPSVNAQPEEYGGLRALWRRALRRLGIQPGREALQAQQALTRRVAALEAAVNAQHDQAARYHAALETLWSVNQPWAWEDNACLVLRRPEGG